MGAQGRSCPRITRLTPSRGRSAIVSTPSLQPPRRFVFPPALIRSSAAPLSDAVTRGHRGPQTVDTVVELDQRHGVAGSKLREHILGTALRFDDWLSSHGAGAIEDERNGVRSARISTTLSFPEQAPPPRSDKDLGRQRQMTVHSMLSTKDDPCSLHPHRLRA